MRTKPHDTKLRMHSNKTEKVDTEKRGSVTERRYN
jgi:hypothetical protein